MLIKLAEPRILADAIALLSELVLEVKAKITKNGFEIIAIDPANVALVNLTIPVKAFAKFEVEKDEELGINLEDFKQILRRVPIGAALIIEKIKDENYLKIEIEDKAKRDFSLALINFEAEEKKIPELTFSSKVHMDTSTFSEVVNDAAIVADSCSFTAFPETFVIEAKGTLHKSKTELSSDEVTISTETKQKAKYSIDYLIKFAKASKFADKVVINFSQDYPAKFEFKGANIEVDFILAPRVEEE
jgi:proliferating cell nuclear antigen